MKNFNLKKLNAEKLILTEIDAVGKNADIFS